MRDSNNPENTEVTYSVFLINKKRQAYKPDSVESYYLSGCCIAATFLPPTQLRRTSRPQSQSYLALHRIEFT
jgi:hypothetical protein